MGLLLFEQAAAMAQGLALGPRYRDTFGDTVPFILVVFVSRWPGLRQFWLTARSCKKLKILGTAVQRRARVFYSCSKKFFMYARPWTLPAAAGLHAPPGPGPFPGEGAQLLQPTEYLHSA